MSGVDELVRWLREQLDEDEQVARAASPAPWESAGDGLVWSPRIGDPVSGSTEIADAAHVARWDPARALAEVDAKRRILDWCERTARIVDEVEVWSIDASDVVELLALPYADRAGYREEWRP